MRTTIGMGVIIIVFLFAPAHSFGGAKEQLDDMNAQMGSGLPVPVQSHKGHDVGQVIALASNSEVAYFIVRMNGSEGFVPVPFSAARYDPQRNAVVLLDKGDPELAQSPAAIPDEAQRPEDPELEGRGHGYYGQEPGQQDSGTGTDSEEDTGAKEGSVNI